MTFLLVGYILAYASYMPIIARDERRRLQGHGIEPESRLWWLQYLVILLPIGLLGSAMVISGPPIPCIAPLLFSVLIAMANFAIYYATLDYMVAAYGIWSASATGGNGFARDFLAGMAALVTRPMYMKLGVFWSTILLGGISALLIIPVYWFRWKGHEFRARSAYNDDE
jgi:hypothetical protein